jgi:hypothetical protein
MRAEEAMDTKLYLTIAAIIALLYTLAFLLFPEGMSMAFSAFVEPHATLNLRFLGGANLAWGLILWFARDWDRDAVRGVLICSVAGLIVIIIINIWGTVQGLLNSSAWGSTIVLALLLLGALYSLATGPRRMA